MQKYTVEIVKGKCEFKIKYAEQLFDDKQKINVKRSVINDKICSLRETNTIENVQVYIHICKAG